MDHIIEFFTGCVPAAYAFAMFFCGAAVGSFLNVVICRLPYGLSLLSPPSACPKCGKRVLGLDNLPVLSWLLLRGRCRWCKEPISWRYPGIELLNGLLWAAAAWCHASASLAVKPPPEIYANAGLLLTQVLFLSCLVAVTFIDFDHQIIPDEISLGGLIAALIVSGILPVIHLPHHPALVARFASIAPWIQSLMCAFLGAMVGGGLLWGMRTIGTLAFRKQIKKAQETDPEITSAIGLGDVKLMAFVGAFLGWKAVLAGFFVGTLVGAVVGVADKLRTGTWPAEDAAEAQGGLAAALAYRWQSGTSIMPYGPFLSIGSAILLFLRGPIIGWFEGLFTLSPPA